MSRLDFARRSLWFGGFLCLGNAVSSAQDAPAPATPPTPPGIAVSQPVVVAPCPEPVAPTPDPFAGDLHTRPKLTGDWGGWRTHLFDGGLTIDSSWTQFYQGVTRGGADRGFEYGGKLDTYFNLDGGKAGLLPGSFITVHIESRHGNDANRLAGTLSPVNLAMLFPTREDITVVSGVKFTQALSDNVVLYFGKINTVDEYQLNFSSGRGLDRFMNASLVFPLNDLRCLPYSTLGAGFAILKDKEPVFSLTIFDAVDHPTTSGLNEIADKGVVLVTEARLPVTINELPGHQIINFAWSYRSYNILDRSAFVVIPGECIQIAQQSGSWSANYNFDQYLWVNPCDKKQGWGVFGATGLSDPKTCPVHRFLSGGIGGNNPLGGREQDTFGIGYYYLGLSESFKDLLNVPVLGGQFAQRNEHGLEVFYNAQITPWCRLTGDVQIIEPSTRLRDTAVVLGMRLKVDF